jgi:hypothetical protein
MTNENTNIFLGENFINLRNHVDLLIDLETEYFPDKINAFHDGYICCFDRMVKAIEMDYKENSYINSKKIDN